MGLHQAQKFLQSEIIDRVKRYFEKNRGNMGKDLTIQSAIGTQNKESYKNDSKACFLKEDIHITLKMKICTTLLFMRIVNQIHSETSYHSS